MLGIYQRTPNLRLIVLFTSSHELYGITHAAKTAQKWQRLKKEKDNEENLTAINIKMHLVAESQAEILIGSKYSDLARPGLILVIESGK